jgi:hypothetical protein
MSRNASLIGKRIEVVYRCGTIDLFASGLLLDDAEDYIVIEQHADQHGSVRAFQLKIPYEWIVRFHPAIANPARVAN